MTCSARLPVYALLIGAFIPIHYVFGVFNLQGIVLFALYLAGILGAMLVGWVMKHIRRDKSEHALMMELPSYRVPKLRDVAIGLYERGMIFLKRQIGRASCRERVCQYVSISVVAVSLKKTYRGRRSPLRVSPT